MLFSRRPGVARRGVTPPSPIIETASVPGASKDVAYTTTLSALHGALPLVWDVSAGTLPTGVTLATTGVLSGTPTVGGTFDFTARVTDGLGRTDTKVLSLVVTVVYSGYATPQQLNDGNLAYDVINSYLGYYPPTDKILIVVPYTGAALNDRLLTMAADGSITDLGAYYGPGGSGPASEHIGSNISAARRPGYDPVGQALYFNLRYWRDGAGGWHHLHRWTPAGGMTYVGSPNWPGDDGNDFYYYNGGFSFNPTTRKAIFWRGAGLLDVSEYDVVAGTWATYQPTGGPATARDTSYLHGCYYPKIGKHLVRYRGGGAAWIDFAYDDAAHTWSTLTTAAAPTNGSPTTSQLPVYDPNLDAIVVLPAAASGHAWYFDGTNWFDTGYSCAFAGVHAWPDGNNAYADAVYDTTAKRVVYTGHSHRAVINDI